MQAHARVCEENKLELELEEKNDAYWINFAVEDASFKDHIRRLEGCIKMIFLRMIHHSIKVLVIVYFKHCCMCKMTLGYRNGKPKLVEWLVVKNGCANLIDRSAISSTQQEVPGL